MTNVDNANVFETNENEKLVKQMSNVEIVNFTFSIMKEIEVRKEQLSKELSELDKQREDILHRLEMPYHGSVGAKMLKQLKNISRNRRQLKVEMDDLNSISGTYKTSAAINRYKNRKKKRYAVRTSILENLTGDKKGEILDTEE